MPGEWFLPLFYMSLGALVLLALQQAVRLARRIIPRHSQTRPTDNRRLHSGGGVIDTPHQDVIPERYWLWDNLTAREMEIARLVAQGKHNAQVARELQISPLTVETHLKHAYAKLHVTSRTELAHALRELVD